MKKAEYGIAEHTFTVMRPETTDEYDALAKEPGAALEQAVQNEVYHGTAGDWRNGLMALIAEVHGVAVRQIGTGEFTGEGDAKKEVTRKEKWSEYYKRACGQLGKDPDAAPFQDLADRLSVGGDKEVLFHPAPVERKAKVPTKISDAHKAKAKSVIAKGNVDKFLAAAKKKYALDITLPEDATSDAYVEELARGIKRFESAAAAAATDGFQA